MQPLLHLANGEEHEFPAPGLAATIRGFWRALFRGYTYLPHRNLYAFFGLLWGLPVPAVTATLYLTAQGQPLELGAAMRYLASGPWQLLFLFHPVMFSIVFGAIGTLARDQQRQVDCLMAALKLEADTDGLTGLLNHRAFQQTLRAEVQRAIREEHPVSLMMIDIDHFKTFNDTHGHQAGDKVLRDLAIELGRLLRPYDVLCRYGGEEFALILPSTPLAEATGIARRLQEDARLDVTWSGGVAERHHNESIHDWIARADHCLYRAKAEGRDRIVAE